MLDVLIVILVYLILAGLLYFGGYRLIRVLARIAVTRSPKPLFLSRVDVNDDYVDIYKKRVHRTDSLMLDWYFSHRIIAFISDSERDYSAHSSRDIPEFYLSQVLDAVRSKRPLPAIASVTAAAKAIELPINEIALKEDKSFNNRAIVLSKMNYLAEAYTSAFVKRVTSNSGTAELNLSEIASLSRLCHTAKIDVSELFLTCDPEKNLESYIDECKRTLDDDRFIGYAVKRSKPKPCSCGTFFWHVLDDRLGLTSYPRSSEEDNQDSQRTCRESNPDKYKYENGLRFLLNMTYDASWGGFSAYTSGIPTLIHTELAIRLFDAIRNHLDVNYPGSLNKTIEFIVKCKANGGFGLFPGREFDLNATKSAIVTSRIIGDIQGSDIDILERAGITPKECVDSVNRCLQEITPGIRS